MHEYEFRIVVQASTSFLHLLTLFGVVHEEYVLYVKPHFRFRDRCWEKKRPVSVESVYHDSTWFNWVHSIEIPFQKWSKATCLQFIHAVGNFQNPFRVENRQVIRLDEHAKLYTFQRDTDLYRCVFEWEYGTFTEVQDTFDVQSMLEALSVHRHIYSCMRNFEPPPYTLSDSILRKSVTSVQSLPQQSKYLYADKLDGMFGTVYSYSNQIKENWEDYNRVIRPGMTLGNGFVFAAEKMEDNTVFLLDVYEVRGHKTSSWSRKSILTEFLPRLSLPELYRVQRYCSNIDDLELNGSFPTDGVIAHHTDSDHIYKYKTDHSIDLIYYEGYFWSTEFRIPALDENLEAGSVYEISTVDGHVVRRRPDRFKSNTPLQMKRELKHGWHGPPMEFTSAIMSKRERSSAKRKQSTRSRKQWTLPPKEVSL